MKSGSFTEQSTTLLHESQMNARLRSLPVPSDAELHQSVLEGSVTATNGTPSTYKCRSKPARVSTFDSKDGGTGADRQTEKNKEKKNRKQVSSEVSHKVSPGESPQKPVNCLLEGLPAPTCSERADTRKRVNKVANPARYSGGKDIMHQNNKNDLGNVDNDSPTDNLDFLMSSLKGKLGDLTTAYVTTQTEADTLREQVSLLTERASTNDVQERPDTAASSGFGTDVMDCEEMDRLARESAQRARKNKMNQTQGTSRLPLHFRFPRVGTGLKTGVLPPHSAAETERCEEERKGISTEVRGGYKSRWQFLNRKAYTKEDKRSNLYPVDIHRAIKNTKEHSAVDMSIGPGTLEAPGKYDKMVYTRISTTGISRPPGLGDRSNGTWENRYQVHWRDRPGYPTPHKPLLQRRHQKQDEQRVSQRRYRSRHLSDLNLYDPDSWQRDPEWDDANCPGAVALPGRTKRRCLACAYANQATPESGDIDKYPPEFPDLVDRSSGLKRQNKSGAKVHTNRESLHRQQDSTNVVHVQ